MVFRAPWSHLARRFFGTLVGRIDPDHQTIVEEYLNRLERSLFETMSAADQRHSLDLCERLRQDGQVNPDLLRAALLHDVGKGTRRFSVGFRVMYTLALIIFPRLAAWLSSTDDGWRRPFYVVAQHPRIGAAAAKRAGSTGKVVSLIAGHGTRGSDPLGQTLYDYDRRM